MFLHSMILSNKFLLFIYFMFPLHLPIRGSYFCRPVNPGVTTAVRVLKKPTKSYGRSPQLVTSVSSAALLMPVHLTF